MNVLGDPIPHQVLEQQVLYVSDFPLQICNWLYAIYIIGIYKNHKNAFPCRKVHYIHVQPRTDIFAMYEAANAY